MPAEVDGTAVAQRIVEAAARLPAHGAVTGWAALCWMGARWLDGRTLGGRRDRDVTLVSATVDLRPQPGVALSAERLLPSDVEVVDGIPVTVPARSVCFEQRYATDPREGIVVADMAAAANLVDRVDLDAYSAYLAGWTGVQKVREALPLMEENSWSPPETRVRLVWVLDAGLGRPLCNVPVFDRTGRHLATPDLLDPLAGVVVEYDGAEHHLGAGNRRRDVRRESVLRDVGLEYVTVVAGELADREGLVARFRRARSRARWQDPAARTWTIALPAGWRSRTTVALRRAG